MLHRGPHARLPMLNAIDRFLDRTFRQRAPLARRHGHVPFYRGDPCSRCASQRPHFKQDEALAVECEPITVCCICVMLKGHPLVHKKVVTPKDLDGLPFIFLNRDYMTHFRIGNAFAPHERFCAVTQIGAR